MLDMTLQRLWYTKRSTCGSLSVARLNLCTLELPVLDGKPGSAIPPGRYKIELQPSPKFLQSQDAWVQRFANCMPHVICPPRTTIMFHWGNTAENTDGCILVGLTHDLDEVGVSRDAFEQFYSAIEAAALAGECFVNVQGGIPIVQPAELNLQGDA